MEQIKYVALGDNFLVDKAKKINETLEKINAPYYQVCKKMRGKANKDAYAISWRKKNMSCDSEYPNVTATSEKVVDRYLQKNYNVSLNSLIRTPIASIKKANDYVLKINAEKEKKEQLKRKKIEEREAKRLAKSTKTSKKENKRIEKETEKEIQKIVSKTGNNQEVKIENNDGKVAIFYTLTSNGKRRNHAKLNFANNRVTYLNSNTPQYVKDHIKQYKLITSTANYSFSPAKETPVKEERDKSIKSDKQDYLNYKEWRKEEREKYKEAIEEMYSSIKNDLPKEIQNVIELLPIKNGYKIEFNTNDSNIIRINIDIDRSIKSGKDKDVNISFNYQTQGDYIPITYLDGTDLFEKGKVYNDAIRDIVSNIKQFSRISPVKEESKMEEKKIEAIKTKEIAEYIKKEILQAPLTMDYNFEEEYGFSWEKGIIPILEPDGTKLFNFMVDFVYNKFKIMFSDPYVDLKLVKYKLDPLYANFDTYKDDNDFKYKFKTIFIKIIDLLREYYPRYISNKSTPKEVKKESSDLYSYKLGIFEELQEIVEAKAKKYGYTLRKKDFGENWKSYSIIGKHNSYHGVVRIDVGSPIDKEIENVKLFEISLQSGDFRTGITERIKERVEDLKQYDLNRVINNQVNKFFESVYSKEYGKSEPKEENTQYIKATDFARKMGIEVNEMKPINQTETTEIVKETPAVVIDDAEAEKFDKGLDELTKLLQQAMQ